MPPCTAVPHSAGPLTTASDVRLSPHPASHKDHAANALKKLTGPHLPASLKQLERAIDRAHQDAKPVGRAPEPPDVEDQPEPGIETPGEDEPEPDEDHADPVGAE